MCSDAHSITLRYDTGRGQVYLRYDTDRGQVYLRYGTDRGQVYLWYRTSIFEDVNLACC